MKRPKSKNWIPWLIVFCFAIPHWKVLLADETSTTSLEPVTVTATRTAVDPEFLPVSAYTVDRQDIEAQPSHFMNNFGEYIRDLPGVHVAQYYPWGPPWIQLRGTGHFLQRTVYLIDGIPVHAFLSPAINPNDIERVDVVLGPSSALYGASAAGGAVNIITRSGKPGEIAAASMAYGSNNTFRPHVSTGDDTGRFNFRLSYSGDFSDGYQMRPIDGAVKLAELGRGHLVRQASVEDNEYKYNWLSGKAGWKGFNGARLDLAVHYMERYLYGGQPNYIINDYGGTTVSSIRLIYPLGEFGRLSAATGYQFQDIPSQTNQGARIEDGAVVVDPTIIERGKWDRQRIPLELQGDFNIGASNILTAGLSWSREEEERPRFRGVTGERIYRYELTTETMGVYLQNQSFFLDDRLSLLAGVRYDEWKYKDIFDQGSSNQTPDDVKKDHVTYRAGAKYIVTEALSLRSSAGTAFWPGNSLWFFSNVNTGPAWRQANPDLKPEKTRMVDLGADMNFARWDTLLGVTGYYGVIEDIAAYTPAPHPTEPNTTLTMARNIGEAEIRGVEIYLRQPVTARLFFTGALTLNHSRITADDLNPDNEGNQLRNSPDYFGSLGLRYLNPQLVNGEVLFRFSDKRYYDDNNERLPYYRMEAFETLDVKIWRDWRIAGNWLMNTTLSVVNVLDEVYHTEWIYVNPGRHIEGSIGVRYLYR